jgi:hypothetical protein
MVEEVMCVAVVVVEVRIIRLATEPRCARSNAQFPFVAAFLILVRLPKYWGLRPQTPNPTLHER